MERGKDAYAVAESIKLKVETKPANAGFSVLYSNILQY